MRSAASARCRVAGILSAIFVSLAKILSRLSRPIRQGLDGGFPPLLSRAGIGLAFPWRLGIPEFERFLESDTDRLLKVVRKIGLS
jgi:hypothetical protein